MTLRTSMEGGRWKLLAAEVLVAELALAILKRRREQVAQVVNGLLVVVALLAR